MTPQRLGTVATTAPNVTARPPRSAFKQVTVVHPARSHTSQQTGLELQSSQLNPASTASSQTNTTSVVANNAGGQAQSDAQRNQGSQKQQQQQRPRPWYERTGTPPPNIAITTHNQAYFEDFRDERIPVVVEQLVMDQAHPTFQATVDVLVNAIGCVTAGDLDGLRKPDFTDAGMQVAPAVKLERVTRYFEYVQQGYREFQELAMYREWLRMENRNAAWNRGGQAGGGRGGAPAGGIDRQVVTDILSESRRQTQEMSDTLARQPRQPRDSFDGSKVDTDMVNKFSQARDWTIWNNKLRTVAIAGDFVALLADNFEPSTTMNAEERKVFKARDRFLYQLICSKVTENQAQPVLRKYSIMDDPSGYLLYREITKIYTTGIGAKQRRVQLERELDTMRLDKEWQGTLTTFLTKYSKVVDQHREMCGPHARSDQYYIDKLDAAIAPHPQLGAYSSELDMFETRLEKRMQDILRAAGADTGENTQTVTEEAAESYEDHLNVLMQRAIQIDNENALRKKGERKANNANQSQGTSQSNQSGGGGGNNRSNRQANNANSNSSSGNGNKLWRHYPKEEWDKLPDDKRKEILKVRKEHKENKNRQANQTNQQASNNGSSQGNQQQQGNNGNQGGQSGSILRGMMSANQAVREKVDSNGVRWREIHSARINYRVSRVKISEGLALCDSGANGGMAGSDCRIMEKSTTRSVTVTGVTDGVIDSPLCTASAVVSVMDEDGKMKDVVLLMHQYATKPDGNTIHSKVQLEHMGLVVHDTPAAHGGLQVSHNGSVKPVTSMLMSR